MKYLFIIMMLVIPSFFVNAATSNFTVKAFIGYDSIAPTTPVLTSVIPVSINQINIDWQPSIDNVFLAGYRIFRDGLQIATTTQTSFNDVGLTASTTYAYNVDAFDSFENFSSSSAVISTTTFSIIVLPPVAIGSTSSPTKNTIISNVLPPTLASIQILPDKNSVKIFWKTNNPTRYDLSWGRTESYELGTISSNEFRSDHETVITDLEPGTTYLYQLRAINGVGVTKVISFGQFTTLMPFSTSLPPNVSALNIVVKDNDVYLNWKNVGLPDNYVIRVVKSYLYYPLNTQDGAVVYEGREESVNDLAALNDLSPQYYTVFVYDQFGLVSSGAIIRAVRNKVTGNLPIDDFSSSTHQNEESYEKNIIPDYILQSYDINVIQASTTQIFSPTLLLRTKIPFLVTLPVNKVAKNVKSIVISIQDPSNNHIFNTFILKLNKNGDAYETVIAPTEISGLAKLQIGLFDFSDKKIVGFFGVANFIDENNTQIIFPDAIASGLKKVTIAFSLFGSFCFLFWLFIIFSKRKCEDNY